MPPLLSEEAVHQDVQALRQRCEDVSARLRGVEAELLLLRKEMFAMMEKNERVKAKKLVLEL
jgi:hypothetical protein